MLNFTKSNQFSTRLTLNGKTLETVKEIKLLGTILTDNLKWEKNIKFLVKRAYARMELLRKISNFTSSGKDKILLFLPLV